MYAIIKTGGKQYRVREGDELRVEKLVAEVGDRVSFDQVVAVGGEKLLVGRPFVDGYAVGAEVLEQGKGDKLVIYKYKAKKDYRRKNGHRQPFTLVKITGIGESGAKPAEKKAAEKSAKVEKAPAAKAEVSMSMKKDELLAIARDMGIELPSKTTKLDILNAIESK